LLIFRQSTGQRPETVPELVSAADLIVEERKMYPKKIVWIVGILVLAALLAACGGGGSDSGAQSGAVEEEVAAVSTGDPVEGKKQYDMLCIACHGPTGEGVEGLGKPFTTSEFVRERNDQEMLEFVKIGRPIGDPLNSTGVDMPPKGGNPALTDEQILDIVAYVRTLQK
jgi:mono/diheme cytochrome c family protein